MGGHYTAAARMAVGSPQWLDFNDDKVSLMEQADVCKSAGYAFRPFGSKREWKGDMEDCPHAPLAPKRRGGSLTPGACHQATFSGNPGTK